MVDNLPFTCSIWLIFYYSSAAECYEYLNINRELPPILAGYFDNPDDDNRENVSTPLHEAILGVGPFSLTEALSLYHGDIDQQNDLGFSPLHTAIMRRDIQAVKDLLAYGASVTQRLKDGASVLHMAAFWEKYPSTEMSQALLNKGADPNAMLLDGEPLLPYAFDNPGLVHLLLHHGARVLFKLHGNAQTPLSCSAIYIYYSRISCDYPMKEVWRRSLKILIDAGMDINIGGDMPPLLNAMCTKNNALLDLLLGFGARADVVDSGGFGILWCAAMHGNLEQIEILRRAEINGVSTAIFDTGKFSPMDCLWVRKNHIERYHHIPGVEQATSAEYDAFQQLVKEIKCRNDEDELWRQLDGNGEDGYSLSWMAEARRQSLTPLVSSGCTGDNVHDDVDSVDSHGEADDSDEFFDAHTD